MWTDIIEIDAPADVVWRLTLDVEGWPALTPTMRRVERLDQGPIRVGSAARVWQPAQFPAVWTVTRVEADREFSWQTRRPGLTMTGSHLLEPVEAGCRNTLTLDLAGPLAAPLGRLLGRVFGNALRTENAGFKAAAERSP